MIMSTAERPIGEEEALTIKAVFHILLKMCEMTYCQIS